MKKDAGYHILRVGMGVTFLWIGILILADPLFWGGFLEAWLIDMLPLPLETVMVMVAVVDLIIGFLLLIDVAVWIVSIIAALHLVAILITGIDSVTVRDIGLLTAMIALIWADLPAKKKRQLKKTKVLTIAN